MSEAIGSITILTILLDETNFRLQSFDSEFDLRRDKFFLFFQPSSEEVSFKWRRGLNATACKEHIIYLPEAFY